MFRHAMLAVVLAATPAVPALADDNTPAAAEAAPDKSKKVCRRQVTTGSVMPKSVCRTVAQWEALTEKAKSDLDRTRDMERSRSTVGGNRS
jgi:hypothetical protein